jgi:hypothetical protein
MKHKLLTTALAATAAMFLAATTAPAQVHAGINARTNVDASVAPPGFHHGHKVGWRGGHHPPGWSRGRKVGWHHA